MTKQNHSDGLRERILQSSLRLFADKGYDNTGVAEICAASDASKGAFYHHFPSKQAVFLELLKDWLQGLDAELGRALDRSSNVPEGLVAMAAEMKNVFSAADGRVQLFLEFWQQARRDPEVWKEFIAPYRRYQGYFSHIIQKGIDQGSLRRLDAQAAGHALVALAVGIVVQGVLDPNGAEWDKVAGDTIQLLITGLSSGQPAGAPDRR
jgi:AcrR family transcriptional regulator